MTRPCKRCGEPTAVLVMGRTCPVGTTGLAFRLGCLWTRLRRNWAPMHHECLIKTLQNRSGTYVWIRARGYDE